MISVIIPVYNAEKSIEKCLSSIKNQTWKGDFEIIVVNDGSADKSSEIIEKFRENHLDLNIQVVNQENGGVSKARNTGLKISKGNYIALLDADDEWYPEKIEKQMKIFQSTDTKIDFLTSLWNRERITFPYQIEERNNLVKITLRKLLLKITGQTSTALFRRTVLDNTGYFDENQNYSEDANYWLRVSENNSMYLLPEILVQAGNGKKGFGQTGLSANLNEMEKGIQKNILEMYQMKRINTLEYFFYLVISKLKYFLRPLRAKL